MIRLIGALTSLLLAVPLTGQQARSAEPLTPAAHADRLRVLGSLRDRLGAAVRREHRLLDARIHHDLGLAVDEPLLQVGPVDLEVAAAGGATRLAELRAAVTADTREWAELRQRVAAARQRNQDAGWDEPSFRAIGVPGAADLQALVARAAEQRRAELAAEQETRAAVIDAEEHGVDPAATPSTVVAVPVDLTDQVRAPAKLGHALLQIGSLRQQRARSLLVAAGVDAEDHPEAAVLFARAEADLLQARDILQAACRDESVPRRHLFALARCHEKLGDVIQAEDLYLDLVNLGTTRDAIGEPMLDQWAEAAQTAMLAMRWWLESSDWHPRHDPRKIDLGHLR